jgi:hypothetical protein
VQALEARPARAGSGMEGNGLVLPRASCAQAFAAEL